MSEKSYKERVVKARNNLVSIKLDSHYDDNVKNLDDAINSLNNIIKTFD